MQYLLPNNQYVRTGDAFELNGVQYPSNWISLTSAEEKQDLGLQLVTESNSRADDYYYIVTSVLQGAVITYTNTAKDLTFLKKQATDAINRQAYSLLAPTDYMSIKALETNTTMPDSWKTWRESIRTTALNAKIAINASTDIASLIIASTVTWANNPDYVERNV
jgi:DNA-binding helix-hairpin-helix protein with protein kinase domain